MSHPSVSICPFFTKSSPTKSAHGNTSFALTLLFHMRPKVCLEKNREAALQRPLCLSGLNCLFKCCHGESQRRMPHLFFPFELSSWIVPGRPHPAAAPLGGTRSRREENLLRGLLVNLPHFSIRNLFLGVSLVEIQVFYSWVNGNGLFYTPPTHIFVSNAW